MLNYIWLTLLVIGILCAVGNDVADQMQNNYRNGIPLDVVLRLDENNSTGNTQAGEMIISRKQFADFYNLSESSIVEDTIRQNVLVLRKERKIQLLLSSSSPRIWQTMAEALGTKDKLIGESEIIGHLYKDGKLEIHSTILFDAVTLVRLRAVTQTMFEYAGTAVTIALGLIGIMALWLGMMKIAEAAGILKVITKFLSPIMRRIFPEVPPDHPAMAAMVMNIAANMLGLSNAATPLGIKAMEELQTLNTKKTSASNPMVTFLAINTGGLTLIPATAIAIRAGLGSANPTIIIGTTIFGASLATVVGILTSKFLQRFSIFNRGKKENE